MRRADPLEWLLTSTGFGNACTTLSIATPVAEEQRMPMPPSRPSPIRMLSRIVTASDPEAKIPNALPAPVDTSPPTRLPMTVPRSLPTG